MIDIYDVIGSGVKEAPELYSDTCSNAEQTYIYNRGGIKERNYHEKWIRD
jgi:hypothetical protein